MSARNNSRLEDYQVLGVIGTGTFGTCYKVQNKLTGQMCVWKAVKYGSMKEDQKKLLVSEVNLLSQLRHSNIVHYYDRIIDKTSATLYIIMEYCEGGDLSTVIKRCKSSGGLVMEAFVWHVLYQMARALQACHWHAAATILHRDIKPANVFLDRCYNVKLGDFGLARALEHKHGTAHTLVGTPSYMSPEVMRGSKYNKASDVWALGCLLYELCALAPPFIGSNMRQLARCIVDGRFERIPVYYTDRLQTMITLLLDVDQERRPGVEDVLQHPVVVSQVTANKFASMDLKSVQGAAVQEQDGERNRLESLRHRESAVRAKEILLMEREREVERREKFASMLDRLAKEKVARADVYLRQCREARPAPPRGPRHDRRSIVREEELDSSFSADPGDSSPAGPRVLGERRVHFTLPAARDRKWDTRILSAVNENLPAMPGSKEAHSSWLGNKGQTLVCTQETVLKENVQTLSCQSGITNNCASTSSQSRARSASSLRW